MADGGIRQVTWASGRTQRIDTAVRRNLLWGLANLSCRQAEMTAEQVGADGMEITWHDGYRPTHDWGGLQFHMDKWKLEIKPQMEEPNCYHRAFAIVMGVSTPAYSRDELGELRAKNKKEFKYKGETFNRYEAEQRQRRYEASLRQADDRIFAFGKAGDSRGAKQETAVHSRLMREYTAFSDAMELPVRKHRYEGILAAPHPSTTTPLRLYKKKSKKAIRKSGLYNPLSTAFKDVITKREEEHYAKGSIKRPRVRW